MRRPQAHWIIALFIACLIAAAACNAPQMPTLPTPPSPPSPPLVLRSYKAPEGQEERLTATLRELIARGDDAQGRVVRGPNAQILVAAPESLQGGVASLLQEISSAAQAAPRTIQLRYWLVLGQPAASPAPRGPRLQELAAALDGVVEAEGPMRFTLLEKLTLQSMDGEFARAQGRLLETEHNAAAASEGVLANIDLEVTGGHKLQTRVALQPGQTVVLSQSGFDPERARELLGPDAPLEPTPGGYVLFYVVQAALP